MSEVAIVSDDDLEKKIEAIELEIDELKQLIQAVYDLLQNTLLN